MASAPPTTTVDTSPLDKARAALLGAKAVLDAAAASRDGLLELADAENFSRLMSVARAQAHVAQAEALERLVAILEGVERGS